VFSKALLSIIRCQSLTSNLTKSILLASHYIDPIEWKLFYYASILHAIPYTCSTIGTRYPQVMSKKKKRLYAVVDLETTGGLPKRDKITEIAIILFDGKEIVEEYQSLVNPERSIPPSITRVTGITNDMVAEAPKFYEIAKKVIEMTEGAIFVAHNVRFDYQFLRYEFRSLGYTFTRRNLCTVRLSRKAFPQIKSYSLGNLIRYFHIKVEHTKPPTHQAAQSHQAGRCGEPSRGMWCLLLHQC